MEQIEIIEKINDLNMNNTNEKDKFDDEIIKLHQDQEIGKLFSVTRKKYVKEIIETALKFSKLNDIFGFNKLYEEIHHLEGKIFNKKEIEALVYVSDCLIEKNYKDLNIIVKPFSLLNKLRSTAKKVIKLKLDWKIYYKIFFMLYGQSTFELNYLKPRNSSEYYSSILTFYSNCIKYFEMDESDYNLIKSEVLRYISSAKENEIIFALNVINAFLPKKFLTKDGELQTILYKLMVNKNHLSSMIFSLIKKIIKEDLLIDIPIFINSFFNIMNNLISQTIYIGAGFTSYKKKKLNKKSLPNDMMYIVSALLFDEKFSSYRKTIDKHFVVWLNLINYELKENSTKEVINRNLHFLRTFLSMSREFTFKKEKIKISEMQSETNYVPIEDKKDRLVDVLKILEPLVIKAMCYDEKSSVLFLREAQKLGESVETNNKIIDTFYYIYDENSDNNFSSFIAKLNAYLKVFLKISTFSQNKHMYSFLTNVFKNCIDKISSVSLIQNKNIISFFSSLYFLCNKYKNETDSEYMKHSNFKAFLNLLNNSAILIIKKMVSLLEMFNEGTDEIKFFLLGVSALIDRDEINKIIDVFLIYITDNILDKKLLTSLFNCIDPLFNSRVSEKLLNYCYNSLIKKGKVEEVDEKTNNYLGKFIPQEDYQLDVFNDKKIKYLKNLINFIVFSDLGSDDNLNQKLNNLIYVLLNNKEKKIRKIAFNLIRKVVSHKLSPSFDEDVKLKYPIKNDLQFVLNLYSNFLSPYYENLEENIKIINEEFQAYISLKGINTETEKNREAKKWMKSQMKPNSQSNYKESIEKVLVMFLNLKNCFVLNIQNPLLFVKEVKQEQAHEEGFEEYKLLSSNISKLKEFYNKLGVFLKEFNFSKNTNINNLYFRFLLNEEIPVMIPRTNSIQIPKKMIHLKNLTLKEKGLPINKFDCLPKAIALIKLFELKKKKEECLLKNVLEISKMFTKTTDKKILNSYSAYLQNTIIGKNKKKDLKKLNSGIIKFFSKKIKNIKIENNNLSISDKTMVINICNFYNVFIKHYTITNPFEKIKLIENVLEIIFLITEKNFNDLGTLYLFARNFIKIRYDLPKCLILVERKLSHYPFLEKIGEHRSLLTNKKLEKIINKDSDTISELKEKNNKKKVKLLEEFKSVCDTYYDRLINNKMLENSHLNYILNLNMILHASSILDLSTPTNYLLISKYEEHFFKDLLSDSSYTQKRISFLIWGYILRIKHKLRKEYIIKEYSDQEYEENKFDIIINTKDNTSGLAGNVKYIKFLNTSMDKSFNITNEIEANFILNLTNEDNFNKLSRNLMLMKDVINDQSLMRSGGLGSIASSMTDTFDQIEALIKFYQNPNSKQKLSSIFYSENVVTKNLYETWESNIFYYICNIYDLSKSELFSYKSIFSLFERKIMEYSEANKDKIVPISMLLHILSAKIKRDLKIRSYIIVRENIFYVMKFYTNNTNKRIDSDIVNYLAYVIENMTISDFREVFFDEDENFIVFKYDSEFIFKFVNLVSRNYSLKSGYIMSENILNTLNELRDSYLTDSVRLVKNLNTLKFNISSHILMKNMIYYDLENFEYKYDQSSAREYFQKLLKISKSNEIKEMKQLCSYLVFMYKRFFINEPDLLIEYLLEISKITYLDIEEFEKHLSFTRKNFQFPCCVVNIADYLNHIEVNLKSLDNIHSRKFFVDLLSNLFRSNLNNYNSSGDCEKNFNSILRMIINSQYEIKEYIVNNLLIHFINSLSSDVNDLMIENLKQVISKKENEHVNTNGILEQTNHLSAIFVLGTYLKSFYLEIPQNIQNLIVKMKEFNTKILKNRGAESKLIKNIIGDFFNKYKYTYNYAKKTMSNECQEAISELSRSKSYFL